MVVIPFCPVHLRDYSPETVWCYGQRMGLSDMAGDIERFEREKQSRLTTEQAPLREAEAQLKVDLDEIRHALRAANVPFSRGLWQGQGVTGWQLKGFFMTEDRLLMLHGHIDARGYPRAFRKEFAISRVLRKQLGLTNHDLFQYVIDGVTLGVASRDHSDSRYFAEAWHQWKAGDATLSWSTSGDNGETVHARLYLSHLLGEVTK